MAAAGGAGGGVDPPPPPVAGAAAGDDATTLTASKKEHPFFHYYGLLVHQQNMLQDHVRTGTYQQAISANKANFEGKAVLDVGTGTGILAFFAVQAGARVVYAVEASAMADSAKKLVEANGMSDRIKVIKGKVEEVELPEKVDVIISEPMGFMLVHERMLESYMAARDKFLKPGGLMMPTVGTIYVAPFSDDALYQEQKAKTGFWETTDFYGVNLSSLVGNAMDDHFSQPVVGYFAPSVLLCDTTATHKVDFSRDSIASLEDINIPFSFRIAKTALLHGIAAWFDVSFDGSTQSVKLSTSPHAPGTHWYQCRLLLKEPLAVNATQEVEGSVHMVANDQFSYTVTVTVRLCGTSIEQTNVLNLHDQMYHYLQDPAAATPATGAEGYGTAGYGASADGTYGAY
uniref:type I protein arginine methyltransferase n=1 Tax=Bicosoecida sp. CB-2014 TaxID=1486930 RepID=A0A7S1C457_9STRA